MFSSQGKPVRPYDLFKVDKKLREEGAILVNHEGDGSKFKIDDVHKTMLLTASAIVDTKKTLGENPPLWVVLGDEVDITNQLKNASMFVSTTPIGIKYEGDECIEGILLDDIVVAYRPNVGKAEDPKNARFARTTGKGTGYGLSYLQIGIPDDDVAAIISNIRDTYDLIVRLDSSVTKASNYHWFNANVNTDTLSFVTSDGTTYAPATALAKVQRNLIGASHLTLKLKRSCGFNSKVGHTPDFTLGVGMNTFQLRETTGITPPGIGGLKSSSTIVGYVETDRALSDSLAATTISTVTNGVKQPVFAAPGWQNPSQDK
ncbi:hypothetical protein HDV02_002484 [Globomyces sp. JEL0801]|nr:hypothetical protein HDV02_002484 [Globomyces sp. JEL0801]